MQYLPAVDLHNLNFIARSNLPGKPSSFHECSSYQLQQMLFRSLHEKEKKTHNGPLK